MQSEPSVEITRGRGVNPSRRMRTKFLREVAAAQLPSGPGSATPVADADIAAFPAAARRYLKFMGVVGRPRVWSIRARATGVFRMRPDQPWMPCEAWQYDSSLEIARIFHMRVRFGGIVPVYVRDTYVKGQARMLGRVFDAFSIVDETDYRIQTGELVTYLNDAILFAPSMVVGPEGTWTPVDDRSFDVALTDRGRTVRARVSVDDRGAVTDFSTTDRYGTDPDHPETMVQARWSTPVSGWTFAGGRPMPTGGKAVWHFPGGDFTYADFKFAENEVEWDVPPGGAG